MDSSPSSPPHHVHHSSSVTSFPSTEISQGTSSLVEHRSMQSQQQISLQHTPLTGGRPPRSRKDRPCDRCRRGKARCSIGPSGPPCVHCRETLKECTFQLAPPPRKSRSTPVGQSDGVQPKAHQASNKRRRSPSQGGDHSVATSSASRDLRERVADRLSSSSSPLWLPSTADTVSLANEMDAEKGSSGLDVLASAVPIFDHLADPDTYESHVLTNPVTDDLLPIMDHENKTKQGVNQRRRPAQAHAKQISSDPSGPIFVVMHPRPDPSLLPRPGVRGLSHLRSLLEHHPSRLQETDLLGAYYRHVHPALSVLPSHATNGTDVELPPHLLSLVLATALSHSKATRPLAPLAAALLLNAAEHGPGAYNLITVSAGVLELGSRPAMSSQTAYLHLARTIAAAQLLGLHLNPQRWSIAAWERDLRVRLWWHLEIHDAWMSFLNSRPSHIQAQNSSVPLPTFSNVLLASCAHSSASSDSARSFIASCRLSRLVRRLQAGVCTLGAVDGKTTEERKEVVKELMDKVEPIWTEWKASLTESKPTGVCSFLITLLGFRCMLRRIHIELEYGLGGMFTLSDDELEPFTECVEFVANLKEADLDGYFLIYTSHILSSVLSSLIRFSLVSATSPASHTPAPALIARLVRSLHTYQSVHLWDLAIPALHRAAAVSERLRSNSDSDVSGEVEHQALCDALKGSTESTPADLDVSLPPEANLSGVNFDIGLGGLQHGQDLQGLIGEAAQMNGMSGDPEMIWDWSTFDFSFPLQGLSAA